MIYNVENTSAVGNPVRVFDAEGNEHFYCVECDTETGRIKKFTLDEGGNQIVNWDKGEFETHEDYAPLPLRVEPSKQTYK